MLAFRLIGICMCSALLSGCAVQQMPERHVTIKKTDFDYAKNIADKSKPQFQCPPGGFASPERCFFRLKVTKSNGQFYGQPSSSVIESNQKDCERWNYEHASLPMLDCPNPKTYRYINVPLAFDGEPPNTGEEVELDNDPATGKLHKHVP
jgi:hypothetical protein